MALKVVKPSFVSALDYVTYQQQCGNLLGGQLLLNRRFKYLQNLYRKDLYAHYGCVNAIEFSNDGERMISGGDDKRVLLWNMNQTLTATPSSYFPPAMKSEHNSNIFCLAFNQSHTKILSAGNDEQVILHDVATKESLDVFQHQEAVYGLSADPTNDNLFASSCDDGRVLLWDLRQSTQDPLVLANSDSAYHAVMHNPVEPNYLATANAKEGVCLRDIRNPTTHVIKYGSSLLSSSAMSVRFNKMGNQILALRRRLPPVLYDLTSTHYLAEFDHLEYYNSCTMKSCCFAGDEDQYVLSGSDDFKLYMWKIPDVTFRKGITVKKTHMVLRGHRSIVNQVRYNNTYGVIASSGVEKIIKLWSSFSLTNSENNEIEELRKVYSHIEYINLVVHTGQFMTHDYSHQSTREDPRMMAFFDSLVQRDIEEWTSDSNENSENAVTKEGLAYEVQSSPSTSSLSSTSSDEDLESIVDINKNIISNSDRRPSGETLCPRSECNNREETSVNRVSSNNEEDISSLSDFSIIQSPAYRLTHVQNASNRLIVERRASRRLFSDRGDNIGSRLLIDPDRVMGRFIANREGATGRLLTAREEAANLILNRRQNSVNYDRSLKDSYFDREHSTNPSSDKISQLIAEKRRVHRLKIARESMKNDKILHRKRKTKRLVPKQKNEHCVIKSDPNNNMSFIPLNLDKSNQSLSDSKNKIRKLRMKRAKLSREPNLDNTSSESEDASKIFPQNKEELKSIGTLNNVSNENKKTNEENDHLVNRTSLRYKHCDIKSLMEGEPCGSGTQKHKVPCEALKRFLNDSQNLLTLSAVKDPHESDKNPSFNVNCDTVPSGDNICSRVLLSKNNVFESNKNLASLKVNTDSNISLRKRDNNNKNGKSDIKESCNALIEQSDIESTVTQVPGTCENSESSSCVPVSVVKFARNYRKRSAEDSNDD